MEFACSFANYVAAEKSINYQKSGVVHDVSGYSEYITTTMSRTLDRPTTDAHFRRQHAWQAMHVMPNRFLQAGPEMFNASCNRFFLDYLKLLN